MEFVIAQYSVECFLDKNKSLAENIVLMQKMLPSLKAYDIDKMLIYEKYTNIQLDPQLTLSELALYDGIILIIF